MKVHYKPLMFVVTLLLCTANLVAQISHGGTPHSFTNKKNLFLPIEPVGLPLVNVEQLRNEDAITDQYKDVPTRFAYAHEVDIRPSNAGTFTDLPNGDRVWRVAVYSKDAFSLNITFEDFNLAPGAELYIYNQDRSTVNGAFTHENNKQGGVFATQPVRGDQAIVELYEPAGAVGNSTLTLATVAHDYRDFFKMAVDFGSSGSCNNNVNCPEGADWQDEKRGVAMITLSNGTRWCSGSMVNNTNSDGTPYFLTANHCLTSSVSTWVFYFNYESASCANVNGPLNNSVSGCTLLGSGAASDWALLQLSSTPPASYNVYYNGWDATGVAPTNSVGIHHPAGDIKKISFENQPSTVTGYSQTSGGTTHWRVADWDDGTTEGGSSGSPLFDQNHRIIGQLHGGGAACGNNQPDWYGRTSVSYSGFCQWLAPGCNTQVVNGYDPNQPTVALDAQLTSLPAPLETLCAAPGQEFTAAAQLRNAGTDNLTSATISWTINGVAQTPVNWTGNLSSNATDLVILGSAMLSQGSNDIVATVSNPNGGTDQNPNNNSASKTSTVGSNDIAVSIITDQYGNETTWSIENEQGIVVASGGTYAQAGSAGEYPQPVQNINCLGDGCYTFTINDSYGDGICCAYGTGAYAVTDSEGNILVSGGTTFTGSIETAEFCLENTPDLGCTDVNACNYDADADVDDGSCIIIDGGSISADINTIGVCVGDGQADILTLTASGFQGDQSLVILTSITGEILHTQSSLTIDLETQTLDAIALWRIAYDANSTISVGMSITNLPDCADLSNVINIGTDQAGCDDNTACNYDPAAECNDGSCVYGDTYYADTDNDGYGDPDNSVTDCSGVPSGYVSNADDCDDTLDTVYLGAPGTGEGIDNNCDGETLGDELVPSDCAGDITGDLLININDLLAVISGLGCDSDCGNKDVNNDGAVNTGDLLQMVAILGTTCD